MIPEWYFLGVTQVREPVGDHSWFRSEVPSQPRHPRLTALLEAQAAGQRAKAKRAARRLLAEHGL
jgi:hypothetical protein